MEQQPYVSPVSVMANASANRKGIALALLAIPIGIILWVVIWSMGYVASIASFAIAASAVWLYSVGAKRQPTGGAVWALVGIIVVGVVLSFLSGMVVDALKSVSEYGGKSWGELLVMPDFWNFFMQAIQKPGLWSDYAGDIGMAALFALLGTFGIVGSLLKKPQPAQPALVTPATPSAPVASPQAIQPQSTPAPSGFEPPKQL